MVEFENPIDHRTVLLSRKPFVIVNITGYLDWDLGFPNGIQVVSTKWMLKDLRKCKTMSRIEFQKTVYEIDCLRAKILKEMAGRHLLYLHQFQLIRALRAFKRVKIVLTRTTCKGNNFLNLLRS